MVSEGYLDVRQRFLDEFSKGHTQPSVPGIGLDHLKLEKIVIREKTFVIFLVKHVFKDQETYFDTNIIEHIQENFPQVYIIYQTESTEDRGKKQLKIIEKR